MQTVRNYSKRSPESPHDDGPREALKSAIQVLRKRRLLTGAVFGPMTAILYLLLTNYSWPYRASAELMVVPEKQGGDQTQQTSRLMQSLVMVAQSDGVLRAAIRDVGFDKVVDRSKLLEKNLIDQFLGARARDAGAAATRQLNSGPQGEVANETGRRPDESAAPVVDVSEDALLARASLLIKQSLVVRAEQNPDIIRLGFQHRRAPSFAARVSRIRTASDTVISGNQQPSAGPPPTRRGDGAAGEESGIDYPFASVRRSAPPEAWRTSFTMQDEPSATEYVQEGERASDTDRERAPEARPAHVRKISPLRTWSRLDPVKTSRAAGPRRLGSNQKSASSCSRPKSRPDFSLESKRETIA
ncbi:hypothetical protein SAMN06265338_11419 [Rhodoblastus acidophilus]|uniref:Uncharacterized protein n=1 Tax=Rhodoblastus acidophilus TaxID=1074 RepID=A0A212S6Q1_RHOAC|nr:hypothetical protein [Rhodoblastus acidophilus]SNB80907.1 hypothetical protein SAMN06265338_11419 [Rhodoblastus acidophilus]